MGDGCNKELFCALLVTATLHLFFPLKCLFFSRYLDATYFFIMLFIFRMFLSPVAFFRFVFMSQRDTLSLWVTPASALLPLAAAATTSEAASQIKAISKLTRTQRERGNRVGVSVCLFFLLVVFG